ncbi:hypothetical protein [Bacillus cereus group sp. MYBK257-2]|uniref:hypothetical protein n=1 Tax=unclassified Bacillus cereus group TaxID=2750818 RepID=UPI003F7AE21C|nr:hypothetical protein [Bacillus cereus]MDA2570535.1 hypothetical protein [Bacillus cereus]
MCKEKLMIVADLVKIINANTEYKKVQQKVIKEKILKIYDFLRNEIELSDIELDDQQRKIYNVYIKNIEKKKFQMYTGIIYLTLLSLYEDDDFFKMLRYSPVDEVCCEGWLSISNNKMRIWLSEVLNMHHRKYVSANRKNRKKSLNAEAWKKQWYKENEEEFSNLIIYLNGIVFKLWKSNQRRLSDSISNEIDIIGTILENSMKLPDVKRYHLLKKLSWNLYEWYQQEIQKMKRELTQAICSYNEEDISTIKAQLEICYTIIHLRMGNEEEEAFIKWLRETLIKFSYPLLTVDIYITDFKKAYLSLDYKRKEIIEIGLKELGKYSSSRDINLFITKVISDYNKRKEREDHLSLQIYKQWRDKCVKAFKDRDFNTLLEILKKREEYTCMKKQDIRIYNKINELLDKVVRDKEEQSLEKIFNIYGLYKGIYMKKIVNYI